MRISTLRLAVVGILGAVFFTGVGAGAASAFQPHMLAARDHLQFAQGELHQAVPDKEGHRVNAERLVQQAIDQVNEGIRAGAQ